MKKIFLVLILVVLPVFADDNTDMVYLDLNSGEGHEFKTFTHKIENMSISKEKEEDEDYIFHPTEYIKNEFKDLFFNRQKED